MPTMDSIHCNTCIDSMMLLQATSCRIRQVMESTDDVTAGCSQTARDTAAISATECTLLREVKKDHLALEPSSRSQGQGSSGECIRSMNDEFNITNNNNFLDHLNGNRIQNFSSCSCSSSSSSSSSSLASSTAETEETTSMFSLDFRFTDKLDLNSHNAECDNDNDISLRSSMPDTREMDRRLLTVPVDCDGNTVLHLRILEHDKTSALNIINKAPQFNDLDVMNKFGQTPIHVAVIAREGDILRRLMCGGASISIPDVHGNTPLHWACFLGYMDIVKHLVKPITYEETESNGYEIMFRTIPQDLTIENNSGITCLELAEENQHTTIVECLEDKLLY